MGKTNHPITETNPLGAGRPTGGMTVKPPEALRDMRLAMRPVERGESPGVKAFRKMLENDPQKFTSEIGKLERDYQAARLAMRKHSADQDEKKAAAGKIGVPGVESPVAALVKEDETGERLLELVDELLVQAKLEGKK